MIIIVMPDLSFQQRGSYLAPQTVEISRSSA